MPWPRELGRIGALAERRAADARRRAGQALDRAVEQEDQADALREQGGEQLQLAELDEMHGISRETLFTRLRGVAIARAHHLECQLRAERLQDEAEDARDQALDLQQQAGTHQSRARRLQSVQAQLSKAQRRALLRRQEREIEEEIACR